MRRGSSTLWLLAVTAGCAGTIGPAAEPASDNPEPPNNASRPGGASGGAGTSGGGGTSQPPAACAPVRSRLAKLTVPQLEKTVAVLLPSARPTWDDVQGTVSSEGKRFSTQVVAFDMPEPHVASLFAAMTDAANHAPTDWLARQGCLAVRPWTAACSRMLVTQILELAFRRPPSDDEVARYGAFLAQELAATSPEEALQQLARVVTLSPRFLFRSEVGEGTSTPDRRSLGAYELASALSYLLTDGPPDQALLATARSGAIATPSVLRQQATRLLTAWQPSAGLPAFLRERFQYAMATAAPKDPARHPDYQALAADFVQETDRFVEETVQRQGGGAGLLLAAPFTYVNPRLARHYGVAAPAAGGFARQDLSSTPRRGILTQGAWLSTFAGPSEADAVKRGRFIRERVLCETVPPPPPTVNAVPPTPDGKTTQRQRLAHHREDASCASCHALMDPLGLPFEVYDGVGAHRTTEGGLPIDPSGVLVMDEQPTPVPFSDAGALIDQLAAADQVGRCLQTALRSFALSEDVDVGCPLPSTLSPRASVRESLIEILASSEFTQRSVSP